MKYSLGQKWRMARNGRGDSLDTHGDGTVYTIQKNNAGQVGLYNHDNGYPGTRSGVMTVKDPNNISEQEWRVISGTGNFPRRVFHLVKDSEIAGYIASRSLGVKPILTLHKKRVLKKKTIRKHKEAQTKEKKMSLSLDKVYRVTQGQLGGRKLKPCRVSRDGQFAFFMHNGMDVRIHAKHLREMPGALISEIDSKEKESMSELHLVANSFVSAENLKRIEQLKHSLREKTDTNVAEVKAIAEGIEQPNDQESEIKAFLWALFATSVGAFSLIGVVSTVVYFVNMIKTFNG